MDIAPIVALQFLKAARACLYFYHEARQNIPQEQKELKLRLEVEAITFERWCLTVGVQEILEAAVRDPDSWVDGSKFEEFSKNLRDELRFDNDPIANLTVDVLKGLKDKFEDARSRFQPDRHRPVSALLGDTRNSSFKWRSPFQSLRRKNGGTQAKAPDIDIEKNLIDFYGAVKWLTWNKRVFLQLLDDIPNINGSLLKLLSTELQDQVKRRVHIQVLGNSGAEHLSTAEDLPKDKIEIGALASAKRMYIRENNESDHDQVSTSLRDTNLGKNIQPSSRPSVFHVADFTRGTMQLGPPRTQSLLGGKQVLVEWKHYNPVHPLRIEQILRLGSLVGMLNRHDIYKQFHIPYCKGLIQDQENSRIGIIFDFPVYASSDQPFKYSNLQALIRNSRAKPPPPGQRFRIAKDLSIALHYLQSVHWLHKSFRSDNIVYFEPSTSTRGDADDARKHTNGGDGQQKAEGNNIPGDSTREISNQGTPKGTSGSQNQNLLLKPASPPLASFYIVGLDLSRPDHPSELSETLSISTSGYRSRLENIELYSHPESLLKTPSGKHVRFRPEFDIYSLGLVLLEVGLWRTLDSLRQQAAREEADFRTKIRTDYCDELQVRVGVIYWRATQRCLNNDFELGDGPEEMENGVTLQLAFEKLVVCELEKCVA
ncbi:MAG: hypothetical protein M1813_004653 [Trichoglossum hirsutum]|nr:MAG: hypothetical protein M1813_004653 [Trichoglossum hirsutum]